MAKHIVKCLFCGKSFDSSTEEYIKPNSRRYAHKKCFEEHEQAKSKEEKDKEQLENYIKKLFGIDCISDKIKRQIKDFKENKNYSYSGMYKSLKYFFEIKGNSIDKANNGIGIIGYIYDEAYKYWKSIWEAQEKNKNINIEQYILPTKEVHILVPTKEPIKKQNKHFCFLEVK